MITVAEVKQSLPTHLKPAATQEFADKLNALAKDPEMAEMLRENFISYTHVLKEGRFKTEDYMRAVVYVSFKLMGHTNQDSYKRTFPDRHTALVARGATDKDISAYVAAYNKNKLVNMVLEQTLVPVWVLNQSIYQKAINVQAKLMMGAYSEKVQSDAANSLLTHLKKPETKQVELSIGLDESSGMKELKETLASLAQRQQDLIGQGVTTRDIAHQALGAKLPAPTASDDNAHLASFLPPDHTKSKQSEAIMDAVIVEDD